jgi:hypothetical protein
VAHLRGAQQPCCGSVIAERLPGHGHRGSGHSLLADATERQRTERAKRGLCARTQSRALSPTSTWGSSAPSASDGLDASVPQAQPGGAGRAR